MTMIWAAFTSEWTKLKRKTLFLSTFLGLAAAASLLVVLMFSQATSNGGIVTLHQLASEYSLGTLRQLLVRQPRRATLLAGKMLGVISFLVAALCFAAVIALIVAVLAAQSRGVSTHAWFTGTGLSDMFRELGDLALATVGYSVLGMAVGQFVRSAVFAVIIGFAWLIAVENTSSSASCRACSSGCPAPRWSRRPRPGTRGSATRTACSSARSASSSPSLPR